MMSCIFVLVVATSLTTLAAEKNETEDGSINATSKFFETFYFSKMAPAAPFFLSFWVHFYGTRRKPEKTAIKKSKVDTKRLLSLEN